MSQNEEKAKKKSHKWHVCRSTWCNHREIIHFLGVGCSEELLLLPNLCKVTDADGSEDVIYHFVKGTRDLGCNDATMCCPASQVVQLQMWAEQVSNTMKR